MGGSDLTARGGFTGAPCLETGTLESVAPPVSAAVSVLAPGVLCWAWSLSLAAGGGPGGGFGVSLGFAAS
eukprot:1490667-Alexandrium_andersonii.AAC.1